MVKRIRGEEMSTVEIESLICRYDDTVRYRQQLFNCNFVGEIHSVLKTSAEKQDIVEAQLQEKARECEYLKECLKIAYDKVTKLYTQFEDRTNYYQRSLKKNHAKEFLDFAIFLNTRNKSSEKNDIASNFAADDSFLHNEELLKDLFAKELIEDNNKHEFEALKLQFENETEECKRLKISLNEANERISILNSDLKAAHESLNAEKLERSRVESEKYYLERLLFKFQLRISPIDKTRKTSIRKSSDHSTINEGNGLPISPPFDFRDNDVSVENINPPELFSINQEHKTETNTIDETSNLLVRQKFRKREFERSSKYVINESTSSLKTPVKKSPMQSDVSDFEDHHLHAVQESQNVNSQIDNSESTAVKNGNAVDVLENSSIDPGMRELSEPLETNENLTLSKTLNGCNQILSSRVVELSKSRTSITPVQPHFECDTCGKSFLKKIGIIMHVRVHMKTIQSFFCEKCRKPFLIKNDGQKLEKCPFCAVDDNSLSTRNKRTITIDALERERSDEHRRIGDYGRNQKEVSDIRCIICNKHYSTRSNLTAHMRTVHRGEKPYECTECGKRFARKGHLKTHTFVHGSEKRFKCSVCNAPFKHLSNKRRHEQIVHEGGGNFHCAHCEKRFGQKENLISHIHNNHFSSFQKQFKCTICDKSFAMKSDLQRHKFTHTSKRSFKCSFCDRYFKFPGYKTIHEKTVHGKGVRFRCQHCDKAYKLKAFLIHHLKNNHVEWDDKNGLN